MFSRRVVGEPTLVGYCDSDFAGNFETSKSTTGYVILFMGAVVNWKTQLQRHITLSSTEAEVCALCALAKEFSWIRRMPIELKLMESDESAFIYCDNTSSIHIVESEKATAGTRHLRARHDFIREQIDEK